MKKGLIVLAAGALASMALVACSSGGNSPDPTATTRPAAAAPTATAAAATGAVQGTEVKVTMGDPGGATKKYVYVPAKFEFTVGQTATLVLHSEAEYHTFTADTLGIDIEVDAGKTVNKVFTFDKAGTYKVVCIPHESLGMTAEIVVK